MRKISASEAARIEAARAESARLELARRQHEAVQRRLRAHTQNTVVAIAACLGLVLIFVVGFFVVDFVPTSKRAPPQASTDRFTATRTGVVRFEEGGRSHCRQVDFSNETGQFSNETRVPCYEATSADSGSRMPKSEAGDRLEAIRDAFGKK